MASFFENDKVFSSDRLVGEEHLLQVAEEINEVFHTASINKDDRASIFAALILACKNTMPDTDVPPCVLVAEINKRAADVLSAYHKSEFSRYIQIYLPDKTEVQMKLKGALVKAMVLIDQLYTNTSIGRKEDLLSRFYEAFLRYGNGGKDIGIVMTPAHIARFASRVLNIKSDDIVYDPTCGTGGFLVAALNCVRRNCNRQQFERFARCGIFGIELQPKIAALAVINIILQGCSASHIINDNCLSQHLAEATIDATSSARFTYEGQQKNGRAVSKVLMNPPFSLKGYEEQEFRFIIHALDQMKDGGLLFSIVPYAILVKQGQDKQFRKHLLKYHTLLSVITFPFDLFYPVGVVTAGIIVQKGNRHPRHQNVLWIRIPSDGYVKIKGRRLLCKRESSHLEQAAVLMDKFIKDPEMEVKEVERLQTACPIDMRDNTLELVPEAYLKEKLPTSSDEIIDALEKTVREFVAFSIWSRLLSLDRIDSERTGDKRGENKCCNSFREISLEELLGKPRRGMYHVHGDLSQGDIPLVSTTAQNNGVAGYYDIPKHLTFKNAITVASDGAPLTAFYHPYVFTAKDNVVVFQPDEHMKLSTLFYIITEINKIKWRFSYGRKCYLNKINKVKIVIPVKQDGTINSDYIECLTHKLPGWYLVEKAAGR